jgi:hypothetical protein
MFQKDLREETEKKIKSFKLEIFAKNSSPVYFLAYALDCHSKYFLTYRGVAMIPE